MQRETFSHNGAQVEKTTHPDGSMDIIIRGCGDAMCPGDGCRMRDAVVTLHVDANGKKTHNGPEHMRELFRAMEKPMDEATKRQKEELEDRIIKLNMELVALDEFDVFPGWAAYKAEIEAGKVLRTAEKRALTEQLKKLVGVDE